MKPYCPVPKFVLGWIVAALVLVSGNRLAQAQTFSDSTFNAGDWHSTVLPNSVGGSTAPTSQDTSHGLPPPSRLTHHQYPTGTIHVAHVYQATGSTYNPATQGAIVGLDYAYDLNHSTNGNVRYWPLVSQNGAYYYGAPGDLIAGPNSNWSHFTGVNLTAASFTKEWGPSGSSAHPDFSCTGSAIAFGYMTQNTNSNPGTVDITDSRIDNWNMTVKTTTPCCVTRPAGMVGWWQMDEPNGATVVNDIAGFNNQGTPKPGGHVGTGGPSAVAGEVHGALYFAGPYVEVAPQADLDFGVGDFSIDAWVKPVDCSHSGAGHYSPIVDKFKSPIGYVFYLDQPTVGVARLYLKINGSPAFASTGTIPVLGAGTWSHVAVTVARPSGGPLVGTFYINGLPAGTFTPPAGSVNNTFPMWIGKTRIPGGICENAIDELELFKRALSAAEVKSIADAKSAGKCP